MLRRAALGGALLAALAPLAHAGFPGRNGALAFVSGGSITVVPPGGKRHFLGPGDSPAWSPDGMKLAFVRDRDIWTMTAEGSEKHRIVRHTSNRFPLAPAWSPDGARLAYGVALRSGAGALEVADADGANAETLVTGEDVGQIFDPAWSPDGRRIAYVTGADARGPEGKIWVVDADGGNPHRLVDRASDIDYDVEPAWAPDGKRFAFTKAILGPKAQIVVGYDVYVARADGSRPRLLVVDGRSPAWSPDGMKIVFEHTPPTRGKPRSAYGAPYELYSIAASGAGKPARLTRNPTVETQPDWQPLP